MSTTRSFLALLPLVVHFVRACDEAIPLWQQCGGITYSGPSHPHCVDGAICQEWNPYYFQCIPDPNASSSSSSSASSSSSSSVTQSSSTSLPTDTPTSTSTSTSSTSTQTPTFTPPVVPLSPTGLAALAKSKDRYIGSAFDNGYLSDTAYTNIVLSNVNQITCENSMKWESIEATRGVFSSPDADRMVQLAEANGMTIRGHTLVWHSQLPSWVSSGNWTTSTLTEVITSHITGVMTKYKGKIHTWDVVNEVIGDDANMRPSVFYNTLGESFIDLAFNTAKAVDPKPILAINDYNMEYSQKATAMYNLVKRLKSRGVPVEQIGAQAHLVVGSLPSGIKDIYQNFASLGVSVAVTELDIRMPTPPTAATLAQQAADYVTVVKACLDVPQCLGVTFWGLTDKYSWVPDVFSGEGAACLYDESLQPKPDYTAVQSLLSATPTSTTTTASPTDTQTTVTSSPTSTFTPPVVPLSPTGLAALAKSKDRYMGSAFENGYLSDSAYTSIVLSNVNQITCENSMKWESIEATRGVFSSPDADRMVQLAEANGMTIRGHTLVWHSQLPSWVANGNWTTSTLTEVITSHITGVMTKYKGKIHTWDVVNEVIGDDANMRPSVFYNTLGESFIDLAFNTAKAVDPKPILAINDYNMEYSQKATAMYNLVKRLKSRGVPVEQIGAQAHLVVGSLPTGIKDIYQNFASLGVSVAVTELDIRMPTPPTAATLAQQAVDYVTVVKACLDVPQCLGVTFWGLTDKYSWVPGVFSGEGAACLYDESLQPKPDYTAVQSLLSATPTSTTTTASPTDTQTTVTSSPTSTFTPPVVPLSPTGLAALAKSKDRYMGSAFENGYLSDSAYTNIVLSNVNQITCENSMKWESIEATRGVFSSPDADRMVQVAEANGMTIRGHTLVWHSQLPSWVANGNWTTSTLTDVITSHITGVMTKYKGKIHTWDVVNEVIGDDANMRPSVFYNTLGESFIDLAFNIAKAVDPKPILAINDYNMEYSQKATAMYNLVKRLKSRGVPVEQIGAQAHLVVGSLPSGIKDIYQNFASLGVSVAVTELDIRMPTPPTAATLAQQAADYVTVVKACLDVPQCLGVTFWGLTDKYSWVPGVFSGEGAACLYDDSLQPKPDYTAVQALLSATPTSTPTDSSTGSSTTPISTSTSVSQSNSMSSSTSSSQ
ncbi:probable endo-1,4-beta-xylanase, partial [Serendipita indica DSM 11827]